MGYITAYQGDLNSTQLNAMTIASVGTNTMVLATLPSVGDAITSRSYNATAVSFASTSSATYNRALSIGRTDFLITNAAYNANFNNIKVGDSLTATTYITGGQTIDTISYNYTTINGVGYTRIVMSAVANVSSPTASVDGGSNVTVTISKDQLVSSSTYVLRKGDLIQPANSRYPYSVTADVIRGTSTTTSVTLNRNIITSEGVTLAGETVKIGNSCSWRVVVSSLPTYQLIPGRLVQYTGDFEVIERIV